MSAVAKTCETIEKTLGKSPAFRKVEDRLYVVKQGSAYVTVSVLPSKKREKEKVLVRIYAQVVSGVRSDAGLFRQLLIANGKMRFGAFAYVPEGHLILFVHTILGGEHMDPAELTSSVSDVALIADSYDDRIVATYGGLRMQDVLEEQAIAHMLGGTTDDEGHVVWDDDAPSAKEGSKS
jgi:hypothetical protein